MRKLRKRIVIAAKIDVSAYDYMLRNSVIDAKTGRKIYLPHHNSHLDEVQVYNGDKKRTSTRGYFNAMKNIISKPERLRHTDKIYRKVFGAPWLRRKLAGNFWKDIGVCQMEIERMLLDIKINKVHGV